MYIIFTDCSDFCWILQSINFEQIQLIIKCLSGKLNFYNETIISRIKIMFSYFLKQPTSSLVSNLSVKNADFKQRFVH